MNKMRLAAVIAAASLALTSCGANGSLKKVAMEIGGQKITAGDIATLNMIESGADNFDTGLSNVSKMIESYAKYNALGKAMKIELTDEDKASGTEIRSQIASSNGGYKKFKKYMEENSSSIEFLDMLGQTNAYYSYVNEKIDEKIGDKQATDEELQKYYNDNYMCVKHILIKADDANGVSMDDAKKKAEEVLAKLELCRDLAPLHTGAHIMGIQGCLEVMPNTPQVLVFDTAFHQTMPKEAYMYGVPYEVYEEHAVRRYGAHGTSHRYVAGEMIKLLGKPAEETKIITCHLGNGSSISTVKGGKVIDTSMGFTPLAGVLMGTRCGDMDPAVVPFIMQKLGLDADGVNTYMNKKCGLAGISGVSSDCRDIEAAINAGNERAKLSIDMLCYQIKKFIGSYIAAMNGVDAIVFTAGIGENTAMVRSGALKDLSYFGIELNEEVNAVTKGRSGVTELSTENSKVKIFMIPTNEELVIARDTAAIVSKA